MPSPLIAAILVRAGFWLALLFTPVVSSYWPWWKHDLGWTIAAESWAFAVLLLPGQLTTWFGVHLEREAWWVWLQLLAFAVAISIFPWRAWATYRVQRKGVRRARARGDVLRPD